MKWANLSRIECQHHHDDPHQRLISALSAYFPWLFIKEILKTEILNRNRTPSPHLKKKKLWKKREVIIFISFSPIMETVRGEDSVFS